MSNMATPITIPEKVDFQVDDSGEITVKGPLGELRHSIPSGIEVDVDSEGKNVSVKRRRNDRQARAEHGLHRSLLANMVEGVHKGFEIAMEIYGMGYSINEQGGQLVLKIGFCHDVRFDIPDNISLEIEQNAAQPGNPARFKLRGIDKHQLGQFAANVRKVRPPEPYKGKGIRYVDERVQRKEGKAFAGLE